MHIENIIEKMRNLKLFGMIEALRSQEGQKDINQLSFSERIGLLLEHEILSKEDRRLASLLRQAKLREAANIESIIYKAQRGLQKTKVLSLSTGKFIKNKQNLIITGATGTGKTYTMEGLGEIRGSWENDPNTGIIPRALSDLFDGLRMSNDTTEYSVRVSFLEMYNEEIYDLLSPGDDLGMKLMKSVGNHCKET